MYYPNLIAHIVDNMHSALLPHDVARDVRDVPHKVVCAALAYVRQCEWAYMQDHGIDEAIWMGITMRLQSIESAHMDCSDYSR